MRLRWFDLCRFAIPALIIFNCLFFIPGSASAGSTHVPVGSWIYGAFDRLEAEGIVSGPASKPVTRARAARLTDEALERCGKNDCSPVIARLVKKLEKEFDRETAGNSVYGRYFYSDGSPHALNINNNGDEIREGSNLRAGLKFSARPWSPLSLYINPEARYPQGSDDADLEIVEAYAAVEAFNIEVSAGREAMWWGPGQHGALLITDNAKPLDMIRVSNTEPWDIPFVGQTGLTLFASRLEADRYIPDPFLAGGRLEFRPHPSVQIGLSRVAMFGGEGRDEDLSTIWDVITARNENTDDEPGNQIASFDLKLVLPFRFQPVTVYAEIGGEDEAGFMPSKNAYLAGVYLPRVHRLDWLELRAEWANNYVKETPLAWYRHHIYKSGYTYEGRIIGHHMGSPSENIYLEALMRIGMGELRVWYDHETSMMHQAVKPEVRSFAAVLDMPFERMDVTFGVAVDLFGNIDGIAGNDDDVHSVWAGLEYFLN